MARPVIAHRGPEFLSRFRAIQAGLKPILGRAGAEPFLFASTGIGTMESAVVNVAGPAKRVLIANNGQWGPVFKRLALALGSDVHGVVTPPGDPVALVGVEWAVKARA